MIFWFSGGQLGSKNRPKNDQKTEAKREAVGASIFDRFWRVLGAKLGGKMEPKSSKKGIEKTCLPKIAHLAGTASMKERNRIVCSLVGAIIPGVFSKPMVTTVFEDAMHGSNMMCSILIQNLMLIKNELGALPDQLTVHADNTYKDSQP